MRRSARDGGRDRQDALSLCARRSGRRDRLRDVGDRRPTSAIAANPCPAASPRSRKSKRSPVRSAVRHGVYAGDPRPGAVLDGVERIGDRNGPDADPREAALHLRHAVGRTGLSGLGRRRLQSRDGVASHQVACEALSTVSAMTVHPKGQRSSAKPRVPETARGRSASTRDRVPLRAFREAFGCAQHARSTQRRLERTWISTRPTRPVARGRLVADVAGRRGVDPVDLVLDLALGSDLAPPARRLISIDEDGSAALADRATVSASPRAGAHTFETALRPLLLDAFTQRWVREAGSTSLEEGRSAC